MTSQGWNDDPDLLPEQAVLGSILLEGASIERVLFLEPRDFKFNINQTIFENMLHLYTWEKPIDLVTVTNEYLRFDKLDSMGGVQYLSELARSVPTSANIEYYAEIVRSKALRRRGVVLGNSIIALTKKDFDSDEDYFSAIEDLVADMRPEATKKMKSFAETRKKYYEHLKTKAQKLLTGLFKQFDAWAQIWRGWLYIIAGRPSVGKTAKAIMLAYGIAKYNPDAGVVLFFSQEMDEDEIKDRIVSMVAEVNYVRLINKGGEEGFTPRELEKIDAAYDEVERLPIFIQDSSGVTIDEIRATAKQFKKKYGKIAAIIVDYLQIMDIPQRKNENRAQAIGRVTASAKAMARNMKFCFIMLCQLNRDADTEEPGMKHLKESGNIEQDADVIEFLWYNPKSQQDGSSIRVIDSIFGKGRNIGVNRFQYLFKWWFQKYEEIEKKPVEKKVDKK